ncbi:MAG: DUF4902 domain-containing protein [Sedimenticola sp.]
MLSVSSDGYVRLTLNTLRDIPLTHCISGLDDEGAGFDRGRDDSQCDISGYTEWVSATEPAISVGWDWRLQMSGGGCHYSRAGSARSNLMLIGADNEDLGPDRTARLIESVLDAMDWQSVTFNAIGDRYN